MGKIFCIIGKSSTGKDCLFKKILEIMPVPLSTVITYTTRPIRSYETEGVEYHFTNIPDFFKLRDSGKVIEYRCYHTIHGDWYYFTADDGQITEDKNILLVTTLEGYDHLVSYYGKDRVVAFYVDLDDRTRLERAFEREKTMEDPKYVEMCRRFVSDSADFSDAKLLASGITKHYFNYDFDKCLNEICTDIKLQC